jgi:hypothetical protein
MPRKTPPTAPPMKDRVTRRDREPTLVWKAMTNLGNRYTIEKTQNALIRNGTRTPINIKNNDLPPILTNDKLISLKVFCTS